MDSKIVGIAGQGETWPIYQDIVSDIEFTTPSKFMKASYETYKEKYKSKPSTNGLIFEYCIAECLFQMKIGPFYYQANLNFVPNSQFDFVCFHDRWPNVLSCKVSLRERYKQADLEGWVLKQVYRKARVYLLTTDQKEVTMVENKIYDGEVIGLDECIGVYSEKFDKLLRDLRKKDFQEAKTVMPIQGNLIKV